jgi:hypothetical protein
MRVPAPCELVSEDLWLARQHAAPATEQVLYQTFLEYSDNHLHLTNLDTAEYHGYAPPEAATSRSTAGRSFLLCCRCST